MSLTKEVIMSVDCEVEVLEDDMLKIYNKTYAQLNEKYPNSYFQYRVEKSYKELINRGQSSD